MDYRKDIGRCTMPQAMFAPNTSDIFHWTFVYRLYLVLAFDGKWVFLELLDEIVQIPIIPTSANALPAQQYCCQIRTCNSS